MITAEPHIEILAQHRQHANRFQTTHSHQDAQEEEDRVHINARQHLRHALLSTAVVGHILVLLVDTDIEDLRHRPQHAKHEQDAHKRRQMGNGLEDRYKDQTAHAEEEDYLALGSAQAVGLLLDGHLLRSSQFALQRKRKDIGRNDHRHERRDENLHDDARSRDHALVPEHDGRHVADRREGATRVGRNDDQRGVDDAVCAVAD